jgi:PII-like signaling protein
LAKRLTIVVGEQDRYGHRSLASELVERAHAAGLAGVTVSRGIEGYGKSSHLHTARILSLSDDLPISIVVVDEATAVETFAAEILELFEGGLVTVEDVQVLRSGTGRHGEARGNDPG